VLQDDLPGAPVVAKVDRNRILQVLANLISNAVKFSPDGEPVTVRLRPDCKHALISVIDNGPGVAEEFRARLFDRFTQQDGTSSRVQQGTGLGLAISRSIVEGHGGTIRLDADRKEGATLHVELPLSGQ